MSTPWQLQDAKNKFSEVISKAISSGPQEITRHGQKAAVVLSFDDYKRFQNKKLSLSDFFKSSPLREITFSRHNDIPRNIDL